MDSAGAGADEGSAGRLVGPSVAVGPAETGEPLGAGAPERLTLPGRLGHPPLLRRSATPGAASIPASRTPSAAESDPGSLGFPVPLPPPPRVVAEPAALGGVVYRPFPDPRAPRDAELQPVEGASRRSFVESRDGELSSGDGSSRRIPAPFGPSQMPRSAPVPSNSLPGMPGSAPGVPVDVTPGGPASSGHSVFAPTGGSPVAASPAGSGVEDGWATPGDRRRGAWPGRSRGAFRPSEEGAAAVRSGAADGVPSEGRGTTPPPFLGMPGPASGMPDAVVGALGADAVMPAGAEVEVESTGRHTVPDELVQAATYRLPADRVFRARVPEPAEESTARVSVPKPRQS
ncbi:hypothetical protein [Actinoplanes sp. NPDC026619]|uniref:hypothetical protein n=1 Tax=Actinoplanes sp. NPDC026619 TaxID=3155798 RepID=UPI0033DE2C09